ncbi:response regulator transcription factor [Massilia rubra]|uniref:Response regulator n=1 Tax=Massilia rubra TaxID=2607910 RepID=A0ABX0LJT7_9BURK|nr:response regulator [Massilia rubra]NHZ34557.1 response regulator [Massilia rubra]
MDTTTPWIAIVDDEETIRCALLRLLDSAGLAARAYAGGAELLEAMREPWPCAVILDLHMPDIDGHQLQARLAQLAPQLCVIAMTGQHSAAARARVLAYPRATYLSKPMAEQVLLDALGRARADWLAAPPAGARP